MDAISSQYSSHVRIREVTNFERRRASHTLARSTRSGEGVRYWFDVSALKRIRVREGIVTKILSNQKGLAPVTNATKCSKCIVIAFVPPLHSSSLQHRAYHNRSREIHKSILSTLCFHNHHHFYVSSAFKFSP